MTRILVTGGSGFIGSHLVDELAKSGRHVVTVLEKGPRKFGDLPPNVAFVQGNLSDAKLVHRTLAEGGIEVVYHAAWATVHETSLEDVEVDVESNLIPLLNVLEAARATGVRRVVFLSSGGTVYGLPQAPWVSEEHPTNPICAYGITKLAAEKYLKMYRHLYGLEHVIFRPSVPYGPRQNPLRRQGAVSVFTHRALKGEPIAVWGDGSSVRDYFYVGDLTAPLMAALDVPFEGDMTFNLAGDKGYSLMDLIKTVEESLNVKLKVEFKPARRFDVPELRLDTRAAAQTLRWNPSVPLSEGIRRTATWQEEWISNEGAKR
jgi:UDP-glucose 4-epimerase